MAAVALLCVALTIDGRAVAQERPVATALSLPADIECLDAEQVSQAVVGWLGRDAIPERLSLLVEASPDAPRAVGFVVLDGETPVASRRFTALPAPCPDRRAALSLALAIAIDATILDGLVPERPAPVETVTVDEPPPPEPAPPPPPAVDRDDPMSVGMELAFVAPVGLLSDPVVGVAVAAEIGYSMLALRAAAFGTAIDRADVGRGRFASQLVAGRLDGCLRRSYAPVELDGCLGVAAGVLFAEGSGFSTPLSTELGWAAVLGRIALSVPSDTLLALRVAVDAHLSLLRPRLDVIDRNREVLASRSLPVAGLTPSIGVFLRFR